MDQPLAGKSIAILAANGFEEVEMTEVQRALLALGAVPKIISPEKTLVNGWHGKAWGHYFPVDAAIAEALAVDYNMLLLPGGARSIAKLAQNPHTRRIVGSFLDGGKPIASIGDGIRLIALTGKSNHRGVTGEPTLRDEMIEMGVNWQDEPIVVDRFVVSCQGPDHLAAFIEQVTKTFVEFAELKKAA
ncbi:MAG: DJ-1/PfpI family protein [Azospirillaceae bacterium]|nr:DJ-1/PfpI family protein [Azospirillaceae bacterium]